MDSERQEDPEGRRGRGDALDAVVSGSVLIAVLVPTDPCRTLDGMHRTD